MSFYIVEFFMLLKLLFLMYVVQIKFYVFWTTSNPPNLKF